jgi:hypothetical protein
VPSGAAPAPADAATGVAATPPAAAPSLGTSIARLLEAANLEELRGVFEAQQWNLHELVRLWRDEGRAELDLRLKQAGVRKTGQRVKLLIAVEAAAANA